MSPLNGSFKFLTNHALVLLCIAADPEVRIRDIAADLGITERAAQRIVGDLVQARYLDRNRVGRRNRYSLGSGIPTSSPLSRVMALSSLLERVSTPLGAEAR